MLEGCREFNSLDNFYHGNLWNILQKSLHFVLSNTHRQRSHKPYHDGAVYFFRLITFFKKALLKQIPNKTIPGQILAKDLPDAMRFNPLCQTFFHLIDKRFYRDLTLFSFGRYHEKPR